MNAAVTMALVGAYVGIATHDRPLIDHALSELERLGMGRSEYEHQRAALPGKGPDTNSRCSWACRVGSAVASSQRVTGPGSTSPTVSSGTNTACVDCERTQRSHGR